MHRLSRWWPLLPVAVIALALAAIYGAGFRIVGGGLEHLNTLTVTDLPAGAEVYLDADPVGTEEGGTLSFGALAGPHAILANVEHYLPWVLVFEMPNEPLTVRALLIPRAPSVTVLTGESAAAAKDLVRSYVAPTKEKPLLLAGGCAAVFISGERVLADALGTPGCTPPAYLCTEAGCASTIIFVATAPINAVLAYPGRDDTIIVNSGSSVLAMALDPRQPRASGTLLAGKSPEIAARSDGTIVGKDGSAAFSLGL